MNKSEQINELATALSKCDFPEISKTRKVDFTYNSKRTYYKYADLGDSLKIIRPILSKNGLCVSQIISHEEKETKITTMLIHSSGQWISGSIPISITGKAQEVGSQITYFRRYALFSILNLHGDDDDDGAAASDVSKINDFSSYKKTTFDGNKPANKKEKTQW